MTIVLDGKKARVYYAEKLRKKVLNMTHSPRLAIIQVGDREESNAYIKQKIKFGEEMGIKVSHIKFNNEKDDSEIVKKIKELNKDKSINGIILQLPIPNNLDKHKIINTIDQNKDTDGLTDISCEKRRKGKWAPIPATARGVLELLDFYDIEIKNKKVAVFGRSMLAGGPIAEILKKAGGYVTICHSQTPLEAEKEIAKNSDIIVIAIGKPEFLNKDFISPHLNQVVVDVGINPIKDDADYGTKEMTQKLLEEVSTVRFVGDVDFKGVFDQVRAISPVPGGVGQMTVLSLFENLVDCVEHNQ